MFVRRKKREYAPQTDDAFTAGFTGKSVSVGYVSTYGKNLPPPVTSLPVALSAQMAIAPLCDI